MIDLVEATREHAEYIQANLHPKHLAEMEACGIEPSRALIGPLERSIVARTALAAGEPVSMWGVEPPQMIGPGAIVWMLGTPRLPRFGKTLMRVSKRFIDDAAASYSLLECHVDARYEEALAWLRRLGFNEMIEAKSAITGMDLVICQRRR